MNKEYLLNLKAKHDLTLSNASWRDELTPELLIELDRYTRDLDQFYLEPVKLETFFDMCNSCRCKPEMEYFYPKKQMSKLLEAYKFDVLLYRLERSEHSSVHSI